MCEIKTKFSSYPQKLSNQPVKFSLSTDINPHKFKWFHSLVKIMVLLLTINITSWKVFSEVLVKCLDAYICRICLAIKVLF